MFWNPEVITTTGKSLRITQIQFNIIYIMRTNINQGRIQSLAVMTFKSSFLSAIADIAAFIP